MVELLEESSPGPDLSLEKSTLHLRMNLSLVEQANKEGRLRQEDHEFEASLRHRENCQGLGGRGRSGEMAQWVELILLLHKTIL